MPIYVYECEKCKHSMEELQSFEDKPLVKCPSCKKNKLIRVPQVPYVAVKLANSEINTLGHLAARNTEINREKFREEAERKEEERMNTPLFGGKFKRQKKEKPKRPWWRDSDKPDKSLAKLTPKQKQKYILTGEK